MGVSYDALRLQTSTPCHVPSNMWIRTPMPFPPDIWIRFVSSQVADTLKKAKAAQEKAGINWPMDKFFRTGWMDIILSDGLSEIGPWMTMVSPSRWCSPFKIDWADPFKTLSLYRRQYVSGALFIVLGMNLRFAVFWYLWPTTPEEPPCTLGGLYKAGTQGKQSHHVPVGWIPVGWTLQEAGPWKVATWQWKKTGGQSYRETGFVQ